MYVSLYNPGLRSMIRAPGQPSGSLGGNSISAGDIAAVNFMYG
jgi:hypothetical protein